jgi:ABC-2 type transport system ATP-binding protein
MENILEVKGLTKRFGEVYAVNDISFELRRGEILGILGPNGAGKTTTMHMLLGLTTPSSGDIKIFGLHPDKDREEILGRINFSSSYVSLPYSLTVRENLMVFARLYGVRDKKTKIAELMRLFEIEDIKNATIRTLSSGQITRVSLAKSLLNDPEILLLDEPTASLDPDIADKTRKLLSDKKDRDNISILYTSHNMKEMEDLCDRLIFLDHGRIITSGTPKDIIKNFGGVTLEEVFLKIARKSEAQA